MDLRLQVQRLKPLVSTPSHRVVELLLLVIFPWQRDMNRKLLALIHKHQERMHRLQGIVQ